MNRIVTLYKNAFAGLSQPAWMLAVVMFINRAGAMVLPFLSVYLTESLGFSLKQAGIILSLFGLGSMGGAFLGGWLTDKIGHFKVQVTSLVLGGLGFFTISLLHTFEALAVGIFFLACITESLRPANSSSVAYYAQPENVTRAFSLNRMALNLGFSFGPALGGLLASVSYQWLFMADGISSVLAGLFFYFYFRHKTGSGVSLTPTETPKPKLQSPYQDVVYLVYLVCCCLFAIVFFQFFSTLPLYYRQIHALPESQIGGLFALNGGLVFSLEMVAVYVLSQHFSARFLITIGTALVGISFALLNIPAGPVMLYIAMTLLSLAEILAMPFMATIVVQRSGLANRGAYMGLFTLSYSIAHVLGPYTGTTLIEAYGFDTLWWATFGLAVLVALGFYALVPMLEQKPEADPKPEEAAVTLAE